MKQERTLQRKSGGIYAKMLAEAFLIVVVASAIALAINELRESGLPVAKAWSYADFLNRTGTADLSIALDHSIALYEKAGALFLDARTPEEFRAGHINGAVNLSWDQFTEHFDPVMKGVSRDAIIIAYCDGKGCSLGKDLATDLRDEGFRNARHLVNGLTVWRENGMPIDRDK